jgi:hypothetical protein
MEPSGSGWTDYVIWSVFFQIETLLWYNLCMFRDRRRLNIIMVVVAVIVIASMILALFASSLKVNYVPATPQSNVQTPPTR